jgi:RNA polymerase sigma factor (sigma-70 family)
MAQPDALLAEDFAARKRDGFARAYRLYGRLLYTVARNVLGSSTAAEDCVHEALLRVWQTPEGYRPERGALRAFLVACVRNEAMTMLRSAGRRTAREERAERLQPVRSTNFEVVDHVELERLRGALARLPDEQRVALELAYFGNRTHVQVANELGVPLGTIKSRIAGAMRRLAAELAPPAARTV